MLLFHTMPDNKGAVIVQNSVTHSAVRMMPRALCGTQSDKLVCLCPPHQRCPSFVVIFRTLVLTGAQLGRNFLFLSTLPVSVTL